MWKRWLIWSIAVIVVAIAAIAIRSHVGKRRREVTYQSVLAKYSRDLKPGMTRSEVERYLRSRNLHFSQSFSSFGHRRERDETDLVKIGQEAPPWYCSEAYVYVAFEFSGTGELKMSDTDPLERIELNQPYEGCL